MLEGVVTRNTPPLIRQKIRFLIFNKINGSTANPKVPILRTKLVTKKEMNKCTVEILDLDRI